MEEEDKTTTKLKKFKLALDIASSLLAILKIIFPAMFQ
jgi:hypothetical protein